MSRPSRSQKNFSAGLENLGNTCYMNSTLQCLYSVPELRAALAAYSSSPVAQHTQFDGPHRLTAATRDLFAEIGRSGASVTPLRFLTTLRQVFPQFASQGRNGAYMQQDAEECWTGIMETLRQQLTGTQDRAADGAGWAGAAGAHPVVKELFGMDLATVLKSPETGEERSEQRTEFSFKCNITSSVNHVMDGFRLALDMTREASSEAAGRTVVFTGRSCLTQLPAYLTVQLVRFDYRQDTRQRCKIQKEVAFSVSLDVYEFAGEALKASLDGARRRKQEADDKKLEQKNTGQPAVADAAGAEGSSGDVAMGEPAVPPSPTGFYDLRALITHKGRDADSGHYVAYVKQGDGSWMEFDDEKPIPRSEDDILRLRGGLGDHPCAYLMLYKSVLA